MILASSNRRKTLETPENTGFSGSVVADWLQKCVSIYYQNNLNMYVENAAEKSAAFVTYLCLYEK